MRTAFYLLLAINVLFLAWAHWIDAPPEPAAKEGLSRLPRLQLVTELPPAAALPSASAPAAQRMAFHELAPAPACASVGPFNDIASAARTAGLLRDLGFAPRQRAVAGETLQGYWVFVAGMKTDDDIAQVVQKLAASGFTDAHVMKPSPEGRRISVGMFSQRERAERRAKAIQHTGLDPQIAERAFPGTAYWVDVNAQPGAQELHAEGLLAQVGYKSASVQSCPPGRQEQIYPATIPQDDSVPPPLPRTKIASAPQPDRDQD